MVFGQEIGSVHAIIPDLIRFSSTLIYCTQLILVFAGLFIIAALVMSIIQNCLSSSSDSIKLEGHHKAQLLSMDERHYYNDHHQSNIFHRTLSQTRSVTIWSYLVIFSALFTTLYFLLMFTTIVTPSKLQSVGLPLNCTSLLRIGNILLITSRFTLYYYCNVILLQSTSVYLACYIARDETLMLRLQFPDMNRIRFPSKFQKLSSSHPTSDGERYLNSKIFCKFKLYRLLIALWMAIYMIGLIIYTEGEERQLYANGNNDDEDGIICQVQKCEYTAYCFL